MAMAKEKIHRALRRVQVGRGDGWRVWTESLDCCCCDYAQEAGVSMAIEDCNSLGLYVRLVSSARQKQRNDRNVQDDMVRRIVERMSTKGFLQGS